MDGLKYSIFENDEKTVEYAKRNLEDFIEKQKRNLITYTLDSGIMYTADENSEKFVFSAVKSTLYLPLTVFIDEDINENQILWHMYYELAMYSDWKKNTALYRNRKFLWIKEIESISIYLLKKIEKCGLSGDKAYSSDIIYRYAEKEIMSFLYEMDRFASFIKVSEMCPVYRNSYGRKDIEKYLYERGKNPESLEKLPKHEKFSKSLLIKSIYGCDIEIDSVHSPFEKTVFGKDYFTFLESEIKKMINQYYGIEKREDFTRTYIYPYFKALWMEEIDGMSLYRSKGEYEQQIEKGDTDRKTAEKRSIEDIGINSEEQENIIEEIYSENDTAGASRTGWEENGFKRKLDEDEKSLFNYYRNVTKKEREHMKKVWKILIGRAEKEQIVKKNLRTDGKLDVYSFIHSYPEYVEAEKKGSYNNVRIFSRYELESRKNILPERIEISFVVDNSGSMNGEKIDAARRALSVTLLSLEDFSGYLKNYASSINQNSRVYTETYFFGSGYEKIKEFSDSESEIKSGIIKSVVRIDAASGSTDDACCLKAINETVDAKSENLIKHGKLVKMVFEITDGASGFPGLAKKEIKSMIDKGVSVYGIQIGRISENSRKTFDYIWNGEGKNNGISLGESTGRLPEKLLEIVKDNIGEILK